jgi:hypothetical protein
MHTLTYSIIGVEMNCVLPRQLLYDKLSLLIRRTVIFVPDLWSVTFPDGRRKRDFHCAVKYYYIVIEKRLKFLTTFQDHNTTMDCKMQHGDDFYFRWNLDKISDMENIRTQRYRYKHFNEHLIVLAKMEFRWEILSFLLKNIYNIGFSSL